MAIKIGRNAACRLRKYRSVNSSHSAQPKFLRFLQDTFIIVSLRGKEGLKKDKSAGISPVSQNLRVFSCRRARNGSAPVSCQFDARVSLQHTFPSL